MDGLPAFLKSKEYYIEVSVVRKRNDSAGGTRLQQATTTNGKSGLRYISTGSRTPLRTFHHPVRISYYACENFITLGVVCPTSQGVSTSP